MQLSGKTALVTGGGTGIGRETALRLAENGADVIVNYSRSEAEAHETAQEIEALGRRSAAIRADVSVHSETTGLIHETVERLGGLDILVNNAAWTAFIDFKNLDEVTDEIWNRTMAVNVKGPFNLIRAAAPYLQRSGEGVVVNVSSMAATLARGSSIPYCASKAALNVVTRAMARVLAPKVRVNSVAPGVVDTRWVADQKAFVRGAQMQTPMRRIATPRDIAEVILSLVVNQRFVTGQIIPVDGGLSA